MEKETDKVHRINTQVAKLRTASRDILVYFVRKKFTDHVLQQLFIIKLKITKIDEDVFKNIPIKCCLSENIFFFLTVKQKKKSYQWRRVLHFYITEIQTEFHPKTREFLKKIK